MRTIDDLALQSYQDYTANLARETEPHKIEAIRAQVKSLLLGTEAITPEAFTQLYRQWEVYIQNPNLLTAKARQKVEQLVAQNKGRPPLSPEEMNILAAYLSFGDIYNLQQLPADPGISWDSGLKFFFFKLPNPWYLDFPPYSSEVINWNRGTTGYLQPTDQTWEESVATLLSQSEEKLQILDGGVGSGVFLQQLDQLAPERIETTGVGLVKQTVPVDHNYFLPMELLPAEMKDSFDVVVSNYALCYCLWPKRAIQELIRVLKPGKSAFLDIAPSLHSTAPGMYKIMEQALGWPENSALTYIAQQYAGLENFDTIKQLVESWSDETYTYTVVPAKKGASRGTCVGIQKTVKT
jgi:SAM-dependent methyltransferase